MSDFRVLPAPHTVNIHSLETYDVVTLSFMYKHLACLTEHKWVWEHTSISVETDEEDKGNDSFNYKAVKPDIVTDDGKIIDVKSVTI